MHVLLTGATGYIGRRLIPVLIQAGHRVTCVIRQEEMADTFYAMRCEVLVADLQSDAIPTAPTDIDVAYFLVHAMSDRTKDLMTLEGAMARRFLAMIQPTKVQHIIYLGGLANHDQLSDHLQSRLNVESVLSNGGIAYTFLRSSIIIGSGSASFEIIRDLVEKLPVMVAPTWINNRCQPISIHNVIDLLVRVMNHPRCLNQCFDIGGSEILSFKDMMLTLARFRNLRRWIVSVPVLTLRLSSYWLYFVTATNFSLASYLVDSMKQDSICKDDAIRDIFDIAYLNFHDSLRRTFAKIGEEAVVSSWKDAWHTTKNKRRLSQYIHVPENGCFYDTTVVPIASHRRDAIIDTIWRIGGNNGWYYGTWLWQLRGIIDKLVGGVGLRRGRTHPHRLRVGDALDFWRVIFANKSERRLLLYAEMRLPGDAWLEWRIKKVSDDWVLQQTATFRPKGLLGRLYWMALLPLHKIMFVGLARQIVHR